MTDNNPVKYLGGLSGCLLDDSERVNTLADADRLTQKLTIAYREKIMNELLGKFHKAASFVISLDTCTDENSNEVRCAGLTFSGLWAGDTSISGDPEKYAASMLCRLLGVDSLSADTPHGIRSLMKAIARDVPAIRNYYDF